MVLTHFAWNFHIFLGLNLRNSRFWLTWFHYMWRFICVILIGPTTDSQWEGKVQGWSYLLVHKKTPQTQWLKTTTIFVICSQTCKLGRTRQGQLHEVWAAVAQILGITPGGWSHLKAHSHTRLVTDISWQVGPQLGCQLEHVRVASLCGCLASSQHGGRVPRASVSRELDRNWIPFYGLALEVTQCHFCASHRPSPVWEE